MARQASAERTWQAIARFYDNCKKKKRGKKGFPRFKKNTRSVEYKTSGWKLSDDRKSITFTDGFLAGRFEMWGTRDLNFYQLSQIKRVRVVRRADGYYAQFCVDVERNIKHEYTGKIIGIDLGLEFFYTDSDGQSVANPLVLRKSEKRLKRLQRRVSQRKKGSANRRKAINRMARQHLKVSRQRKDHAVKTAGALVASNDLIAYENLQVPNMVKNHKLAKSISDASWSMFTEWVEYFAKLHKIVTVAVPPQYTSTDCSGCGERVQKTLSQRTHQCLKCGTNLHRDHNAAKNILVKGLEVLGVKQSTDGQSGTQACGENHLWLVEGNFGWLSRLVEPGNSRGDSWESPARFGTPN
jgi:putative transposase